MFISFFFFFSSRRRHTRLVSDWSSDVCSSDLQSRTRRPLLQDVVWRGRLCGGERRAGRHLRDYAGQSRHSSCERPDGSLGGSAQGQSEKLFWAEVRPAGARQQSVLHLHPECRWVLSSLAVESSLAVSD